MPIDLDYLLLIIFLVSAIGFSFYCSVAEAVLLSITPSFIATLKESKPVDAGRLAALKSNIDRPLAAILSLNTIAHTVGAAGVGAQVSSIFGSQWLAVASGVMTLLILVFSEIIPKTIGALYWRSLGIWIARSVNWLIIGLYPLVWMSERLTKLLSGGKGHHALTREELGAMAEVGAQEGVLAENESKLFRSMMRFPEIKVADIMTPRAVVIAFPKETTVGEVLTDHPDLRVSRVPIYEEKLDNPVGFVLRTDLLLAAAKDNHDQTMGDISRELMSLQADTGASLAFDALLNDRQHIAIVIDQYGSAVGVVTLEDVIETLIGLEIVDEHDKQVDMQTFARKRWEERAKRLGLPTEEGQ
ncbi:MAG: hemolysin family protein [Planctomycetota bacterium]